MIATSCVVIQRSATTSVLPLPLQTIEKLREFGALDEHLTRQNEAERSESGRRLSRICPGTHKNSYRLRQKDMFAWNHCYLQPRDVRRGTLVAANMRLRSRKGTSNPTSRGKDTQKSADTDERGAQREETVREVKGEGRREVIVIIFVLRTSTRAEDVSANADASASPSRIRNATESASNGRRRTADAALPHPPTPEHTSVEISKRSDSEPLEKSTLQNFTRPWDGPKKDQRAVGPAPCVAPAGATNTRRFPS